ncbi:hypothetical protein [Rhodohalobacter sulfatireducens]|uniref:DUF481 domain-containing protein n=1 Tax=Rhodohalobacter sulfatireducens TaxID=2911366 RepID=A0ABS9KJ22_9BACT|nr:hypothetical protein [Rhodohalobacter sulfatireducens]MCG2590852.1 hypothetical protein [Rhodohalobacter sulfatireducens]
MNKLLASIVSFILVLLFTTQVYAQLDLETGINQGYEWNIFKNPEKLVESSDTLARKQLWQNSIYNEFYIESDYYREWAENRLKLSADVGTDLYYQQSQAHRFNYRLLSSFRSNFLDGVYIELAPELRRERQDGVDRTDLVFSTRLSYHQLEAPLHLDFYLGNKTWLKFEGKYRYKAYDQFDNQQTKYNAYTAEAEFKKSWDQGERFNHEFEIESMALYRDQRITEFETQDSPLDYRDREFTKIELGVIYTLENKSDAFEIEFPVQGTVFYDHPTSNLDYKEIEFGTDIEFRLRQSTISMSLEHTLRDFKNFEVDGGKTLYYSYWNGDIEIEIPVISGVYLKSIAAFTTRNSTRERLTSAFYRAYTTSYLQTGVIFYL